MSDLSSYKKADTPQIRQKALDYLAKREYTSFTLREKLAQKGFPYSSIEIVLDGLTQAGFLSDQRFCEEFTRHRIRQGYGPIRIAAELRQHGIDGELIKAQLSQGDEFWSIQIKKIQEKKWGPRRKNLQQEKARQMRHLQSRGFNLTQIHQHLKISEKI